MLLFEYSKTQIEFLFTYQKKQYIRRKKYVRTKPRQSTYRNPISEQSL